MTDESTQKAHVLSHKLWKILGKENSRWLNRHASVESFVDWECLARESDRGYLQAKIKEKMVRDLCEKVVKVLAVKSSEDCFGRKFTMHGWVMDEDDIITLLYHAYMEGFDDAKGVPISHTEIINSQDLPTKGSDGS